MIYKMTTPYDCGPASIAAVTDIPLDKIKDQMRWKDSCDSRDNLMDSPANHFLALSRLSVPYRVVTCGMILRGECRPSKTVVLIHGDGIIGSWLAQHWVVLAYAEGGFVGLHWGDGTIHQYAFDKFEERYANGGPTATAYEVYPPVAKPVTRWNWWARLIFLWPVIYCFPNSWGVPWDAVVLFNIVWVGMLLSIPTAYALEFFGRTVMKVVEKLRK